MKAIELEVIMDGCALLKYGGSLYEYAGHNAEKRLVFENIKDGICITFSYERLTADESKEFTAVY